MCPCYDRSQSNNSNREIVYTNNPQDKEEIHKLKERVSYLEGALCAIITELEKRKIANQVISQASKSGLIDIMTFWHRHRRSDETRLAKELHKYSEHEQEILRDLLRVK